MAAIIRVKRKLDEDPAENLIVQYKKIKTSGSETDEPAELCLSLITTVNFKDAALSGSMQKTLRRQQLQMSFKSHNPNSISQARTEKRAQSKANRYKIVNSRRAVPVNSTELSEAGADFPAEETVAKGKESVSLPASSLDRVSGFESGVTSSENVGQLTSGLEQVSGSESGAVTSSDTTPLTSPDSGEACSVTEAPVIHDVELDCDSDSPAGGGPETSGSGITLNGQALVSQPVPPAPESSYVYDLYYVNDSVHQYNFREIDNIVSIEAFHDFLVMEADGVEECDNVHEDEDDSNDESNWRNDYPDEDPHLIDSEENEYDSEYDSYEFDGELEQSQSYRRQLNDDFLADALGTRLQVFGDSYSDEDDDWQ